MNWNFSISIQIQCGICKDFYKYKKKIIGKTKKQNKITSKPKHQADHTHPQNHHKKKRIKTLQTITVLSLLPHNIKNRINEFRSLRIMPFSPVVSRTGLPKHKVIRPKDLPIRPRSDGVHRPRLKVHQHRPRNEATATRLVVVDIDALQMQRRVAGVPSSGINPVLRAHNFPELRAYLVPALPGLDVQDLSHRRWSEGRGRAGAGDVWGFGGWNEENGDGEGFI